MKKMTLRSPWKNILTSYQPFGYHSYWAKCFQLSLTLNHPVYIGTDTKFSANFIILSTANFTCANFTTSLSTIPPSLSLDHREPRIFEFRGTHTFRRFRDETRPRRNSSRVRLTTVNNSDSRHRATARSCFMHERQGPRTATTRYTWL